VKAGHLAEAIHVLQIREAGGRKGWMIGPVGHVRQIS
jgi:hypothetical protein